MALLVAILLMALLVAILLMAQLVAILLMIIGGYPINDYWWLSY